MLDIIRVTLDCYADNPKNVNGQEYSFPFPLGYSQQMVNVSLKHGRLQDVIKGYICRCLHIVRNIRHGSHDSSTTNFLTSKLANYINKMIYVSLKPKLFRI